MNYGFTITAAGWRLLTNLLAGGETLEITRVMVGQGRVPEGVSPADLTDLVSPQAQATTTAPIVEANVVSFIVEYRSDMNGGLGQGFWLNEFGIFARDEDQNEVLLYYATLGDYPQYVSPAGTGNVDIRRFPVSIALTDELNVVINYPPLAFMTSEGVEQLIARAIVQRDITIPADGWDVGAPESSDGDYCVDIPQIDVTEAMVPIVNIHPSSGGIAKDCGMRTTARTMAGAVRLYAAQPPEAEIQANLVLLCAGTGQAGAGGSSGGDGSYVLPPATRTSLGGVIIGDNIDATGDGTISVDEESVGNAISAGPGEADEMLDEVFGTEPETETT